MGDYMKFLKQEYNYTSLKVQYLEEQFPSLERNTEGGFGNIVENNDDSEDFSEVCTSSELNALKEQLTKAQDLIQVEKNIAKKANKKLEHVKKVASQRIVESMPGTSFEEDTNHLAMLLATVIQNDDFEFDPDSDKVEHNSDKNFLQLIEDNCGDIPDKDAKLALVRNKVLENMKHTVRRERRLSIGGSTCSGLSKTESRTRQRSEEHSQPVSWPFITCDRSRLTWCQGGLGL